jgi:hypothetical protein
LNVLERIPCGENDSGSDSLLLTCGKHATVHEAIIASAQLGGKVGMDIDLRVFHGETPIAKYLSPPVGAFRDGVLGGGR